MAASQHFIKKLTSKHQGVLSSIPALDLAPSQSAIPNKNSVKTDSTTSNTEELLASTKKLFADHQPVGTLLQRLPQSSQDYMHLKNMIQS